MLLNAYRDIRESGLKTNSRFTREEIGLINKNAPMLIVRMKFDVGFKERIVVTCWRHFKYGYYEDVDFFPFDHEESKKCFSAVIILPKYEKDLFEHLKRYSVTRDRHDFVPDEFHAMFMSEEVLVSLNDISDAEKHRICLRESKSRWGARG